MSPLPKTKGKPGNSSPASSRFSYPRPPLGDFTKVDAIQKQSPPTSVGGPAAVYFGASPVASALDPRLGRDPSADRFHTNTPSSSVWSKPDISTLQRIGHFYFALTGQKRQKRRLSPLVKFQAGGSCKFFWSKANMGPPVLSTSMI